MTPADLAARAVAARSQAYAPYSGYAVGAALVSDDGAVFVGCNVENASYGLTVCAERNAYFAAVAAGRRRFSALAIATENGGPPCGACRQVAREFADDLNVHLVDAAGRIRSTTLRALLPDSFGPDVLRA